MPQFNFQARFAPAVESGAKRQTVRAPRKARPRVGQTARLFTGLRTPAARCLGRHEITDVRDVKVEDDGTIWLERPEWGDGLFPLVVGTGDTFAQADGFASADELVGWIRDTHGLPFAGVVTYW